MLSFCCRCSTRIFCVVALAPRFAPHARLTRNSYPDENDLIAKSLCCWLYSGLPTMKARSLILRALLFAVVLAPSAMRLWARPLGAPSCTVPNPQLPVECGQSEGGSTPDQLVVSMPGHHRSGAPAAQDSRQEDQHSEGFCIGILDATRTRVFCCRPYLSVSRMWAAPIRPAVRHRSPLSKPYRSVGWIVRRAFFQLLERSVPATPSLFTSRCGDSNESVAVSPAKKIELGFH